MLQSDLGCSLHGFRVLSSDLDLASLYLYALVYECVYVCGLYSLSVELL